MHDAGQDDPVVAEVRAIRRQIWEECGRDLDRYVAYLIEQQKTHPHRLYRKGVVPLHGSAPPSSDSA